MRAAQIGPEYSFSSPPARRVSRARPRTPRYSAVLSLPISPIFHPSPQGGNGLYHDHSGIADRPRSFPVPRMTDGEDRTGCSFTPRVYDPARPQTHPYPTARQRWRIRATRRRVRAHTSARAPCLRSHRPQPIVFRPPMGSNRRGRPTRSQMPPLLSIPQNPCFSCWWSWALVRSGGACGEIIDLARVG